MQERGDWKRRTGKRRIILQGVENAGVETRESGSPAD